MWMCCYPKSWRINFDTKAKQAWQPNKVWSLCENDLMSSFFFFFFFRAALVMRGGENSWSIRSGCAGCEQCGIFQYGRLHECQNTLPRHLNLEMLQVPLIKTTPLLLQHVLLWLGHKARGSSQLHCFQSALLTWGLKFRQMEKDLSPQLGANFYVSSNNRLPPLRRRP